MSVISDITGLNRKTVLSASLFFVGLVAPGLLTLYVFRPDLFESLQTSKLLLLSISITAPGLFVPFFISVIYVRVREAVDPVPMERFGDYLDWYGVHSVTNAFNFYLALFVAFLFHISCRAFIWWIVALVLFSVVNEFLRMRSLGKSKQPSKSLFGDGGR